MGSWYIKATIYEMFLYSNQIFRNIYKTSFLLISLYIPILSVLTLALDIVVLYGNVAFFIAVLSTKKRYSSFPLKVFIFQKTCFKVKLMKTFKISNSCHLKICQSLKWRAISEITWYCFLVEPTFCLLNLK